MHVKCINVKDAAPVGEIKIGATYFVTGETYCGAHYHLHGVSNTWRKDRFIIIPERDIPTEPFIKVASAVSE